VPGDSDALGPATGADNVSRAVQPFKQRHVTKAVRGVEAAGLTVVGVRVERDGSILVLTAKPGENPAPVERNEWDQ
jgi:hypothetical protein